MRKQLGWPGAGAVALVVVLIVVWRFTPSHDEERRERIGEATVVATETPAPIPQSTVRAARLVPLSSVDVPEPCQLFEGADLPSPLVESQEVYIELQASTCGTRALLPIVADDDRLVIEWVALGSPDVSASIWLSYDIATDRWTGVTRFEAAGRWLAPQATGVISLLVVEWSDLGFGGPIDARSAVMIDGPQHVGVVSGDPNIDRLWALSESTTSLGWLANPERIAFVQSRGETNVLVLGDPETGAIEPVFEVGRYTSISAAPDGRAIVVRSTDDRRVHATRVLSSAGWSVPLEIPDVTTTRIEWSPNSRLLLAITESEVIVLSPGGGTRARFGVGAAPNRSLIWAPDGAYVLLPDATSADSGFRLLDLEMLSIETVLAGDLVLHDGGSISSGPDGSLALAWWELPGASAVDVGVIPARDLSEAEPKPYIVGRFAEAEFRRIEVGGLSWSPDGDRLAVTVTGGKPADPGGETVSQIAVIDLASGDVSELVTSDAYYSTRSDEIVWTSDGVALVARRMPCNGCHRDEFTYDVIDAITGEQWPGSTYPLAFEDRASRTAVLETTLSDVSDPGPVRTAIVELALEILYGGVDTSPSGATYALLVAPAIGTHVYATGGSSQELRLLGSFEERVQLDALLDENHAMIRDGDRLLRVFMGDGTSAAFAADTPDLPATVELSPSGTMALITNSDGYTLVDPADPAADAVVAWQSWPPELGARRGAISWSGDETRITAAGGDGIAVIDAASGVVEVVRIDEIDVAPAAQVRLGQPLAASWGVDGTSLLFATTGALWELELESRSARLVAPAPEPGAFTGGTVLAPAPDGSAMAVGTAFGVFLPEVDGTWRLVSRVGMPSRGGAIHWSQDSAALAFAGFTASGAPYGIIEVSIERGEEQLVVRSDHPQQMLRYLDGGRIAFVYRVGDR